MRYIIVKILQSEIIFGIIKGVGMDTKIAGIDVGPPKTIGGR